MMNMLFLNHKQKQCGVYQYGYRTANILNNSINYKFIYNEVESENEFRELIRFIKPKAVIYNYHPSTMPWINNTIINEFKDIVHIGIHHEGHQTKSVGFHKYIITDSTAIDTDTDFSVPRPLFNGTTINYDVPTVPTIGSFGFGFRNKGFERLMELVYHEFDEAIVKLHIPFAYYGDMDGHQARQIAKLCEQYTYPKKGIKLIVTHDFKTDQQILEFLASNTLNAFLYDEMPGRGLSSVIDYALSVNVPIAITNSCMFRHIINTTPCIDVESVPLKKIISNGSDVLQQYRNIWCNENLITKYEYILKK